MAIEPANICCHPRCEGEVTSNSHDGECLEHVGEKAFGEREMLRRQIEEADSATGAASLQQLADFIDHLKKKGLRSFKGEVPTSSGRLNVDLTFDRDIKTKRDVE